MVSEHVKIMTPDEVTAASAPHVDRELIVINDGLTRGERMFTVAAGIVDTVLRALDDAGWNIGITRGSATCILIVSARASK